MGRMIWMIAAVFSILWGMAGSLYGERNNADGSIASVGGAGGGESGSQSVLKPAGSRIGAEDGRDIYLLRGDEAQQKTEEGLTKDSAVFSPGGKKAELGPVEGWTFPSLNITLEDGTKKECELTNVFFSSLLDFRWLDENRVVLEGHINPSLNNYIVYDLEENSYEEYCGLFFTWTEDYSKLYYVQPSPHWAAEPVPEKITDWEGTVYYETDSGEHLVTALVLDQTDRYLGFFVESEEEEEQGRKFVVLNSQTKQVLYEEANVSFCSAEIFVQ